MPEHRQDHPTHEDQMHYCGHIRVTLGEEGGDQPLPSHAWSVSLIVDMFQEGLEEQIGKAVLLDPGKSILFLGSQSLKEGPPLGNTRDVGFTFMGPINWASRTAEVEATINTVQEACWAILDTVVEKRTKARRPRHPQGMTKVMRTPAVAYDIDK